MKKFRDRIDEIKNKLASGKVGVMSTDTIYGIVGSALDKKTVERIYLLRKRDLKKPMIVLISSFEDLKFFGVKLSIKEKKILKKIWPGRVSVVLRLPSREFAYLHRGTQTTAFRLPTYSAGKPRFHIGDFLKDTGPLVAPSANLAGEPPSRTIREARKYFGEKVDFYLDAGGISSKPSTLIDFHNGGVRILRKGADKKVFTI